MKPAPASFVTLNDTPLCDGEQSAGVGFSLDEKLAMLREDVGANSVVVREVPAGRTVVGIPARVVGERAAPLRSLDPQTLIDLDHHLIPDPVGKAIGCLLDRIDAMEQELRTLRGQTSPPEPTCGTCAAGELCCEEHRHLRKEAS